MTRLEARQQKKNEALNKIRQIYNPHYKFPYEFYGDAESCSEQREYRIRRIIEDLEKELEDDRKTATERGRGPLTKS